MSIRAEIEAKQRQVVEASKAENTVPGDMLREQAVRAMYGGFGSKAWNEYMAQFATTPQELARLQTRETDGGDDYLDRARAYLVANAICFPGTATGFLRGIDDALDQNLT
jgi:hypothetical protein